MYASRWPGVRAPTSGFGADGGTGVELLRLRQLRGGGPPESAISNVRPQSGVFAADKVLSAGPPLSAVLDYEPNGP